MISSPVPLPTKLAYGLGAVAYGIKDNGFAVFLLIFYNQVIGLPADQVGLAIMIALLVDALVDPAIGSLSDRTRSRIGRRHPWLYGSALPIAISWVLLWNPPESGAAGTLAYLILMAILVRSALSANEVPAAAMLPELTRDYHERTAVLRYRFVFGWAGGLIMLMLAYGYFLAPRHGAPTGPLARGGYHAFALCGALVMAASVIVSAAGTHRRMAVPHPRPIETMSVRGEVTAILKTLSNRPFLLLMAAGVCAYINQGVSFAMTNYLLGFVWQFRPADFLIYAVSLFGGVLVAFVIVTPVAQRLGKKGAASLMCVLASGCAITPYVLRLVGAFPLPGDPLMLPLLLGFIAGATAFGICVMMLIGSMVADIVEVAEERTGRREEGLFYAGNLFMQKCTSGIGIFVSGTILALAGFPHKAQPGAVPPEVLDRLTLWFAALTIALGLASAWLFTRFPIRREDHEARLAKLAVAASGGAIGSGGNP